MGSYRLLTFAYFKPFPGLKYMAGPDWSKKVSYTNVHRLCIETLRKLAIFRYGGFEAADDKCLHETDEEEEECTKPRKQTPTRQQPFKKERVGISESQHTRCIVFGKSVLRSSIKNDFCRCKKKRKSSECSASV